MHTAETCRPGAATRKVCYVVQLLPKRVYYAFCGALYLPSSRAITFVAVDILLRELPRFTIGPFLGSG